MPSIRRSKSPKCHLLALPREIRDKIHRYVQLGQRIDKPRVTSTSYLKPDDNTIWPNAYQLLKESEYREQRDPRAVFRPDAEDILILARTCEQLYKESNQIFYSENTFSFACTWSLYCYLYMIGEEKRLCIRHIFFRFNGLQRVDAFKLLGECESLKTPKIGVEQDTMAGSKQPKLDLLTARGLSTLRKIRGMENLVVDVVEMDRPSRQTYLFPYTVSLDVPSKGPYFKPEKVQEFARMLTEEMNWKKETPEQNKIQDVSSKEEEILQSELKPNKSKPFEVSKTRTLRSSKVQKSTSTTSRRKATKKAKIGGKEN
ncbi:uncharacterized protein EAF01_005833 [Botrytis porri]|uniref:DUF7730 domain-containing protein n=1 Tax=Botrytis porri TaxID=87229 RepID=A0A4Z1L5V7_9HELO|nr:uncharacterized protein EAF01_005833 [Botrytis porri]KAF7905312.1 hypothetical protein EAF01_005833 [Botrytis porri]TGO92212.1 hypothetical protein BPOR_0008g00520 [Botrytis porri]